MSWEYRPGMKFYEALFRRDGVDIFHVHMHAADEADLIARAIEMVAKHPQIAAAGGLDGATVEIKLSR